MSDVTGVVDAAPVGDEGTGSYNGAGVSDRDTIRFLIGDKASPFKLSDAEIDWTLTQHTNVYEAAAVCAETLAGHYAKLVSRSMGRLSVQYGEAQSSYRSLATRLRREAALRGGGPDYGGDSWAEWDDVNSDPDRKGTAIEIDGMTTDSSGIARSLTGD